MLTLTNVGTTYDAIPASKGLGLGLIDFTGVTQVTLVVKASKVGTGIQSWQLWATDIDGVSNGVEVGVINDAGAAGDKTLNATFAVAMTGTKLCRVRAKSTVAGDDPIMYCCAVQAK